MAAEQPHRLAELLPRWLAQVPLYQAANGGQSAASPVELLRRLPFITKADIRRGFPQNFLGERGDLEALVEADLIELEQTSGTSEERVALLLPRGWWAEQEKRALRLNPLAGQLLARASDPRRVTINSPVCSGDLCYAGVPARSERVLGGALFISLSRFPFLWGEQDLARMAAEASEWEPLFLDVDPVYGVVFALYCERRGLRLPSLRFILSSYEFLSVTHRRILERVFGVPVFDLYGSTETGHLLMEDDQGHSQPSLETALLEVIEPEACGIGELVVTTLTNPYMPLLRYRIGDLVARFEQPYGTRYVVHGRVADAFRTPSGRRVSTRQVDQCFASLEGIAHYQLAQQAGGNGLLRYVPESGGPAAARLEELQRMLLELLELPSRLTFEPVELLMPERSGKFRLGYPAAKERPL